MRLKADPQGVLCPRAYSCGWQLLEVLGGISQLSSSSRGHTVLGITVLAWANCIGDFIADTAVLTTSPTPARPPTRPPADLALRVHMSARASRGEAEPQSPVLSRAKSTAARAMLSAQKRRAVAIATGTQATVPRAAQHPARHDTWCGAAPVCLVIATHR